LAIHLHSGDLPEGLSFGASVAVDSEAMGLRVEHDALCVVQLSAGDGDAHVVQLRRPDYDAPVLKRLLADRAVLKIFHFARFDIAMFAHYLGVDTWPIYCTKTASRLARTYTDRHGLKDVVRETLTPEQLNYAASDVLNLHALRERLDAMLEREGRTELARACFEFLPWRSRLDLAGWEDQDIFAHT
jgi:ribonuclease D